MTALRTISLVYCLALVSSAYAETSQTIENSAPPPAATVTPPENASAPGIRADQGNLRQELQTLETEIKAAEEKLGLGHEASKTWKQTSDQVNAALDSQSEQAASCMTAKADLNQRVKDGDPEVYLRDARAHIKKCDDAASRYRTFIKRMEADVAKIRIEVNFVEKSVRSLGGQQDEQLKRKKTLQQMLNLGTSGLRDKIDTFNKNYVGN